MKRVLEIEKISYEDDAISIIIDFCGGHVRDILNCLEMVSQIGSISVSNVRDHLNLSVITSYYEMLLKIPVDLKAALSLVDVLCERVSPAEIASGLAEAAMNSFRFSNNMAADFTYVDRQVSLQVSKLYGDQLIKIAEYFLRSRYMSQIGLICDILSISKQLNFGNSIDMSSRIIVDPIIQKADVDSSVKVVEKADIDSSVKVVQPPDLNSLVQVKSIPTKVKPIDVRPDGVGNLGSSDKGAYTELDTYVIPESNSKPVKRSEMDLVNRSRDGRHVLTPSAWRREFLEIWLGRGSSE
jgi:DNA polymerase III gamma/tau subunit